MYFRIPTVGRDARGMWKTYVLQENVEKEVTSKLSYVITHIPRASRPTVVT